MTAPLMALTVWQPWASLIMIGAKPWEWRRWKAPAAYVGQQIVIHAGARRLVRDEVEEIVDRLQHNETFSGLIVDKALELLLPILQFGQQLPLSAGLGTARLGTPARATELVTADAGPVFNSDSVDEPVWGWPLTEITPWPEPFPMRGHQGVWRWPSADAVGGPILPSEEVPC